MTPDNILRNALNDGVSVTIDGAKSIKVSGAQVMVDKWLPVIREHKVALLAALSPAICRNCKRFETVEIHGASVPGCLYQNPGAEYPDGWKRLPADLTACLWN